MRGTKSVVHKHIAQCSHFLRQASVVFLFTFVDAAVFKQHHFARSDLHAVDPIGLQPNGQPQQFAQALGHGCQAVFGFEFTFGRSPQVAGNHDGGAGIQSHANGRNAGAHTGVFGDLVLIVEWNVQVSTNEHALALDLAG